MGTIAEKLTYLNTTKTMLKDSLNKFGSSILSTDTFRSYDTKLNEIYYKLPKITSTGQGLTITDVQNGLLDDFKMNGVDLQQNTTTGKNLFDKDNEIVGYVYNSSGDLVSSPNWNTNNEFKKISNNKISLSCKTTYPISFLLIEFDSNKTFIQRQQSTTTSYTFTLNNNTEYLRFCYLNNVGTHDIQIEEGSISTDYEPYTGGIVSPNPDYPQEIKVVEGRQVITDSGKNLFDKDNMIQGFWAYANGDYYNQNTWICTPKIECSGDTTYTYQFSNTSRWSGFVFYDENGNYISTSNEQNGSSTEYRTYTATSPSNARYLVVNIAGYPGTTNTISVSDLINFQLEEGSTATNYEPYYESVSYNIDLSLENIQLAKMPNTTYKNKIYKNNGNWYFEENVRKINSYNDEIINTEYMSTTGQLSIGATIYYVLANPVTTQITNTTLINQLEALYLHTGTNIITISNSNNIIPEIEITRLKELEKLA